MSREKGIIALMGSGELSETMVEVHKELFSRLPFSAQAVFLDTPAGFELNADQISQKAVDYFEKHVRQSMSVASYKGKKLVSALEAAQTFQRLREADFVLVGPGSPTYALQQWRETLVPEILAERIEQGGCLVAASAAALTLGRFTLPVYEIYKVGQELHWVEGINILGHFGFNLVVIPHWNNAEGRTHDTRFCFMGEGRLRRLESLLPDDVSILGLDEHTACLLDLEKEEACIKGLGGVTLRRGGIERVFQKGENLPLQNLRAGDLKRSWAGPGQPAPAQVKHQLEIAFEDQVFAVEESFKKGLENFEGQEIIGALLEFERIVGTAQQDHKAPDFISNVRELFRGMIVSLGAKLDSVPKSRLECLAPLIDELLRLREKFRREKQYEAADAIRQSLEGIDVIVEDTRDGSRWRRK
ncbi:MAG: Type 1 glutamine amidotransferase-like domain-containing protein [Deltaproteobacteria bacterium]|nr:Type 1 glutamine amidotransferase-like domain-containing protein [Deltaproteobacteria bacterium]